MNRLIAHPTRMALMLATIAPVAIMAPARATDFFWTSAAGGAFGTPLFWQPFNPLPPNPTLGPGGGGDTVNFDLGVAPASRYAVFGVAGQNDRLLVHDDALSLFLSGDYTLSSTSAADPGFMVGVANGDQGDVTLTGSGVLQTEHNSIGRVAGSSGAVTINNLQWTAGGEMFIGQSGAGTLTIENGGSVDALRGFIGENAGSEGSATVTGAGSTWTNAGELRVGGSGTGTLTIADGGSVSNGFEGNLGYRAGSTGTATVTGGGSNWNNNLLYVGRGGTGTLRIQDGGRVSSALGSIGDAGGSMGEVIVTGFGSNWTNNGEIHVGASGTGTLRIDNRAEVRNFTTIIGHNGGSTGTAVVSGAFSSLINTFDFFVGYSGNGSLTIENRGTVVTIGSWIGLGVESSGDVTVTGFGSEWRNSNDLFVGHAGNATLTIEQGGRVANGSGSFLPSNGWIGFGAGSDGAATVTGAGSTWTNTGNLAVGERGAGRLTIADGGSVSDDNGWVAAQSGSSGTVTVTGPGSTWTHNGLLTLGNRGMGVLTIADGGRVSDNIGAIAVLAGSNGTATVTGAGSTWTHSGRLTVATSGTGSLTIQDGGRVSNTDARIAAGAGSVGTALVTGLNSTWTNTELFVGGNAGGSGGTAALTIEDQGQVVVDGTTTIWGSGTVNLNGGTLRTGQLDIAGGQLNWNIGTLNITGPNGLTIGLGHSLGQSLLLNQTQRLVVDHTLTIEIAGGLLAASGLRAGSVEVDGGGRLILGGALHDFGAGLTNHGAVEILASSTINGPFTHTRLADFTLIGGEVTFNGLVEGAGIFGGSGAIIFNGGYSPGDSPAKVIVEPDASFGSSNNLLMEIGGLFLPPGGLPGAEYDHVNFLGQLALDGTLEVQLVGGFTPRAGDAFNLFDFTALSGQFAQLNLPALGGRLRWDTSSLYTSGTLSVVPEPASLGLMCLALLAIGWRRASPR